MKNLRALLGLLLVPLLLPVQLGTALLRVHVSRAKRAGAAGDRGALSIELALIVVVVVAIAGAVVTLVMSLGSQAKDKIPATLPNPSLT